LNKETPIKDWFDNTLIDLWISADRTFRAGTSKDSEKPQRPIELINLKLNIMKSATEN